MRLLLRAEIAVCFRSHWEREKREEEDRFQNCCSESRQWSDFIVELAAWKDKVVRTADTRVALPGSQLFFHKAGLDQRFPLKSQWVVLLFCRAGRKCWKRDFPYASHPRASSNHFPASAATSFTQSTHLQLRLWKFHVSQSPGSDPKL